MPKELIAPFKIKKNLPVSCFLQKSIAKNRKEIKQIFLKKSSKILLIIGPCSIHDEEASFEYLLKLKKASSKLEKKFFFVLRFFLEKSRSFLGWQGFLQDPNLDFSCDIKQGLVKGRSLLINAAKLFPLAYEFVDPMTALYVQDLISYGIIGARNAFSITHRNLASSFSFPIGFKNPMDGNIDIALNAAIYTKEPHTFLNLSEKGKIILLNSLGNPDTSLILRGSYNTSNHSLSSVKDALGKIQEKKTICPLLIDCAHGNADKKEGQIPAFKETIKNIALNQNIQGILLESFLFSGSQNLSMPLKYGISITDQCLDLKSSIELLDWAKDFLSKHPLCSAQ